MHKTPNEAKTNYSREYTKFFYIEEHREEWLRAGGRLKRMREYFGEKIHRVAKGLGISDMRLKRFEDGEPVKDAALLERGYELYLRCSHFEVKIAELKARLSEVISMYRELLDLNRVLAKQNQELLAEKQQLLDLLRIWCKPTNVPSVSISREKGRSVI